MLAPELANSPLFTGTIASFLLIFIKKNKITRLLLNQRIN
jgi:hypothetical protein